LQNYSFSFNNKRFSFTNADTVSLRTPKKRAIALFLYVAKTLEKQIDRLVYGLYGLTEEEIAFIEK
jgi:hypothetical protein